MIAYYKLLNLMKVSSKSKKRGFLSQRRKPLDQILVLKELGSLTNSQSDIIFCQLLALLQAKSANRQKCQSFFYGKPSTEGVVQGHSFSELSVLDCRLGVIFIVPWFEVLVRNQMLVSGDVDGHEVATFAVCRFKFQFLGEFQKVLCLVPCFFEGFSYKLEIVMMPLVGNQGLVEAPCYGNLSWNIVVVARRFVDVSNMVNQFLRSNGPPYFPTSGIQHLASRKYGHGPFIVVPNIGEQVVLLVVVGQEIVDVIGHNNYLRVFLQNSGQLFQFLFCEYFSCGVVRVCNHYQFGLGCDLSLKSFKVIAPVPVLASHWRCNELCTSEFCVVDILGVVRLKDQHFIALFHEIIS